MSLKDAHVMRVEEMQFHRGADKKGNPRLEVKYYDVDGESLNEMFYLDTPEDLKAFYFNFTRMHNRLPERELKIKNLEDALSKLSLFRMPMFIIARKDKYYWKIREKVF